MKTKEELLCNLNRKCPVDGGERVWGVLCVCDLYLSASSSDDVRSANIMADENGVECLVIDRE